MNIKHIKKTFTLQHDQADCGIACLSSLSKYYGGDISIGKFRELCGTNHQGTTLLGLYQGANNAGFEAQGCEADIKALIEHDQPVILHTLIDESLQHFMVCYGYKNNQFIIGDPGKGIVYYDEQGLNKIWQSKKCLTLQPNSNFQKKESIKNRKKEWIKKLLKEDYELLGISMFIGLIVAALGMVMAIFSQKLIDDILPEKDLTKLIMGIALVGILLIVRSAFLAIRQFLLLKQSTNFNNRIIDSFYGTLLHLPKPFFDTRKIGELVARLNDTSRIQKVITDIAGSFVIDTLIAVTSIVFLFIYSWQSGLIAVFSMPVYFILVYSFNSKVISSQKELMAAYAQSESNFISTMNGISVIKNTNKQSFFADLNKKIYGNFQEKVFSLGKINLRLGLLSGMAAVTFLITILTFNSYLVFNDLMKLGELMAILGISSTLIPSISNLALIAIPINEAKVAFNRMFEFTAIEPETSKENEKSLDSFQQLDIKNLSFRFAGRKRILENINITIKKGELVALVGESGGGKSTLANILQKFYQQEEGFILLNKTIDLKNVDTKEWRDKIGVVPQDIHLFNGNVLDNICLGDTKEEAERIISFLGNTGFDKYIDKFPNGILTLLGEEGVNLSGGQKQIIAFARALYNQPEILILDEATAAMDRETEQFIISLLNDLKNKMGIFYISHRLHTLKQFADKIYILENSTITTFGTHKELLSSYNFYSTYFK
ncbi:MAG: peptidase domain-containing ABC transporter [Chloroflexia bacterium]|nr:peptidase domain-containing ABC transporter [Chloroflexia bacterium]